MNLYMVLLGCRPEGRLTEQHDVFFGVGEDLKSLLPKMKKFWPGVSLHIDAYRVVKKVGDYEIKIKDASSAGISDTSLKLFFINLGGYNPPEFEEYHKKILVVAENISQAIAHCKGDGFYSSGQTLESSARSHIDDKMEVDDVINVNELIKDYSLDIHKPAFSDKFEEEIYIGYIPLSKI